MRKPPPTPPFQIVWHLATPISRAINTIITALDQAPAEPPEPADLDPRFHGVIDGTPVMCYLWVDKPELYNGKHRTTGHNLQVITNQSGNIVFISKPYVGRVHDLTVLRDTVMLDVLDPENATADKGHVGSGCDTPYKNSLVRGGWRTDRYGLTMASAKFAMWRNEPSRIWRPGVFCIPSAGYRKKKSWWLLMWCGNCYSFMLPE